MSSHFVAHLRLCIDTFLILVFCLLPSPNFVVLSPIVRGIINDAPEEWTLLGSGSQGGVFLVFSEQRASLIAAKVSTSSEVAGHEATILRKLNHRGIPNLISHEVGSNILEIEYIEGQSLNKLPKLDEVQVMNILRQLLETLVYLHSRSIFHGDLKDDNVMLTPDGTVKLIDFGSAIDLEVAEEAADCVQDVTKRAQLETVCGMADIGALRYLITRLGYTDSPDPKDLSPLLYKLYTHLGSYKSLGSGAILREPCLAANVPFTLE